MNNRISLENASPETRASSTVGASITIGDGRQNIGAKTAMIQNIAESTRRLVKRCANAYAGGSEALLDGYPSGHLVASGRGGDLHSHLDIILGLFCKVETL